MELTQVGYVVKVDVLEKQGCENTIGIAILLCCNLEKFLFIIAVLKYILVVKLFDFFDTLETGPIQ